MRLQYEGGPSLVCSDQYAIWYICGACSKNGPTGQFWNQSTSTLKRSAAKLYRVRRCKGGYTPPLAFSNQESSSNEKMFCHKGGVTFIPIQYTSPSVSRMAARYFCPFVCTTYRSVFAEGCVPPFRFRVRGRLREQPYLHLPTVPSSCSLFPFCLFFSPSPVLPPSLSFPFLLLSRNGVAE